MKKFLRLLTFSVGFYLFMLGFVVEMVARKKDAARDRRDRKRLKN